MDFDKDASSLIEDYQNRYLLSFGTLIKIEYNSFNGFCQILEKDVQSNAFIERWIFRGFIDRFPGSSDVYVFYHFSHTSSILSLEAPVVVGTEELKLCYEFIYDLIRLFGGSSLVATRGTHSEPKGPWTRFYRFTNRRTENRISMYYQNL